MEFVIPYDTAGYGTHNYGGTMRMQSGDTAVFPVIVPGGPGAPHGRIVQLTNEMTYTWTAGTGAVWWEDMAMGVSDNNTGCQISWGGYTPTLRLPNYQGHMGAFGSIGGPPPTGFSASKNLTVSVSGDFYIHAGDTIEVIIKHAFLL